MDYYTLIDKKIQHLLLMGKNKLVLYPFGTQGMLTKKILNERYGINEEFIIDNALAKVNSNIKALEELKNINCLEYTFIITSDSKGIYDEIRNSIKKYVAEEQIEDLYPIVRVDTDPREETLRLMAENIKRFNIEGAAAEAGVYQGNFSAVINKYLPDKRLYLFDTFEGFHHDKLNESMDMRWKTKMDAKMNHYFSDCSEELVLSKMKKSNNCIIRKGFFPETAKDINDNFCLVSLDMDIYESIKEGLDFFWPKLVKRGCIFVHDYNNNDCIGVRKAVEEFSMEENIGFVCLPDSCGSIVIVK